MAEFSLTSLWIESLKMFITGWGPAQLLAGRLAVKMGDGQSSHASFRRGTLFPSAAIALCDSGGNGPWSAGKIFSTVAPQPPLALHE